MGVKREEVLRRKVEGEESRVVMDKCEEDLGVGCCGRKMIGYGVDEVNMSGVVDMEGVDCVVI